MERKDKQGKHGMRYTDRNGSIGDSEYDNCNSANDGCFGCGDFSDV